MPATSGEFPAAPSSVRDARRFARAALAEWGALEWEWATAQLVSELATNAVLHARTAFRVELRLESDALVLRVADRSPRPVAVRQAGDEATTGRGLALVSLLASDWGVEGADGGKAVWCTIRASEDVGGHAGLDAAARAGRRAASRLAQPRSAALALAA